MFSLRCLICVSLLLVGCKAEPPRQPQPNGLAYVYDGVRFTTGKNQEYVESVSLVGDGIQLTKVIFVLPDGHAVEPQQITVELLKEHGIEATVHRTGGDGNFDFLANSYDSWLFGSMQEHRLIRLDWQRERGGKNLGMQPFKLKVRGQEFAYEYHIKGLREKFGEPDAIVPDFVYQPVH